MSLRRMTFDSFFRIVTPNGLKIKILKYVFAT